MKKLLNFTIFFLVLALFYATYNLRSYSILSNNDTSKINIVEKPIIFDTQRKLLTAIYRQKHTDDCDYIRDGLAHCLNIKPKIIVLHMTGLSSLEESYSYMKEPVLREERNNLEQRSYDRLNVSSHFLIDLDGSIYRLMPENYMGRHAIGLNHISIGIENVGFNGSETKEQVNSNLKLIRYLKDKFKIEKVISHSDISSLKKSSYYIEKEENYFREKDCGKSLAEKINVLLYK